jgi:hypothetical protein
MRNRQIETFKNWLFERTNLEEVKPDDYLNKYARKQIKKQNENERKN